MNCLNITYRLVALTLALNYFAFQVELFEEEYEANHPKQCDTVSFNLPSLNWESFDKNNAPQAFVFDAGLRTEFLFDVPSPFAEELPSHQPFRIVRDKSPPLLSLT